MLSVHVPRIVQKTLTDLRLIVSIFLFFLYENWNNGGFFVEAMFIQITSNLVLLMHHSMVKLTAFMLSVHLPWFIQKNWSL